MSERSVMQVINAAVRGEVTAEQAAAELSAPYRHADVIAPRVDGPSVLARIGAAVLPRFIGARWRWYRRASGGRWAREWSEHSERWSWREWKRCPVMDGNSECGAKDECHCEVWP